LPNLTIVETITMTSTTPPEIAAKAESLIPKFQLTRLLNSDQAGRRISLLGTIDSQPALFIAERAAFDTSTSNLTSFSTSLRNIKNLGANDIYSWFLANSNPNFTGSDGQPPPDFKLNLIYPCTQKHINKYEAQGLRIVTETPDIYAKYVRPYMQRQREKGALNWVFNIIEGRTEQEDVMYRESGDEGFLLLPDLNWDRKTMGSLHLLGLVERRDIWSVRDLKKANVEWLKHMRGKMIEATVGLYPDIERDQLKLYVHCKSDEVGWGCGDEVVNTKQINRRTTTFTSILCMSPLKLGAHRLLVRHWGWRILSHNLRRGRVMPMLVCTMLI
jgi:m7GpppX diphosphatase